MFGLFLVFLVSNCLCVCVCVCSSQWCEKGYYHAIYHAADSETPREERKCHEMYCETANVRALACYSTWLLCRARHRLMDPLAIGFAKGDLGNAAYYATRVGTCCGGLWWLGGWLV